MRAGSIIATLSLLALGCMSEVHPDYHPETATSYTQTINYGTIVEPGAAPAPSVEAAYADVPSSSSKFPQTDPAKILVLQGTHLDRPSEVVGVVDAHLKVGDQDAALAALRRRASQLGADAVVGVEFHHADEPGEPIHLSGLAVRFLPQLPMVH